MRDQLDTLLSELKKLKQQGVTSVLLEPDTLTLLEQEASRRTTTTAQPAAAASPPTSTLASAAAIDVPTVPSPHAEPAKPDVPTPPAMPGAIAPQAPLFPIHAPVELPVGSKQEQWHWLREQVLGCPVCKTHVKTGKQAVFGVGTVDADIFFCGEAPGAEEEEQGEPFVGPAGQLLTKMIGAMGLKREQVYIGNIMNWRPETDTPYGNRPPTEEEMAFCLPYLKAQLAIVRPKVIVALGATAVNGLLGYDAKRSITRAHGQWHTFETIPTIISFHPSYILRNGTNKVKRLIWEDMLAVMGHLDMPISERQKGFFKE